MSYANQDSEDLAIEKPTIALFASLGWETLNCFHETFGPLCSLGRETSAEVVLPHRLRAALEKLNPGVPAEAITIAIEEVSKDRSAMSPAKANQEIYKLLKDGVRLTHRRDEDEDETIENITFIDWSNPKQNDFFLASQFWISGDYGSKRADLIGFVNGIPLVFIELKASHKKLQLAYEKNLSDYKDTIPQVFWYNGVVIISNGSKARIGSMTAGFEHFSEWKKIEDEKEPGLISLETMIRGVCDKPKLLDLIENFTLYNEGRGELTKLVAKNHQFLGVNNAIAAVTKLKENQGKLGVFWHTQGSGKSYSMVFFSQKVLRKLPGNWTFVIVTDREDLDGQIYRNFAMTGAVLEDEKRVRADSGESLKRMLNQEDHRYLFTLIQKFRTEDGERYPVLSTRSDIIVITDEAHRSQYDVFAMNMRNALPNAAFIGFTGTPLMAGEERTKEVFGDYVSIYNFKESVDDKNTVPLFYENRIPELQLTNANLTDDIAEICDRADLNDDQERKLEREFAREYHLVTREDRLERIGEDIVSHYMGRGVLAKAMVISIDKATAVRTYDKVQKHWKIAVAKLRKQVAEADATEKPELEERLKFFEETDMAVVVSSSQNEIEEFKKKGLDIATHRKRMVKEDLETKFKKADEPLRIVFVCAMWITGFDVPSCSTIYLDKPMKNHTLMQTIARANRVFKDKKNGLIVDYVGVFRNLQKALAIYGSPVEGGDDPDDTPIHDKAELVRQLRAAISATTEFCMDHNVDPAKIQAAKGFEREKLKDDAVAFLVVNDDTRRRYLNLASAVESTFKSLLPDVSAHEFGPICNVFKVLAEKIRSELPVVDISAVMSDVEALLNKSIAADGYVMPSVSNDPTRYIDLSEIDFDALKAAFDKGRKSVEAQKLRATVAVKLAQMVKLNRTRIDFLDEFQKMIDEYNAGSSNVETFFAKLMAFTKKLNDEEKRGIAEQLSEEELVIFDLLTKPDVVLSKDEEREVKKVAKTLMATLKQEKLVLDWKKRQATRPWFLPRLRKCLTIVCPEPTRRNCTARNARLCTSTSLSHIRGLERVCTQQSDIAHQMQPQQHRYVVLLPLKNWDGPVRPISSEIVIGPLSDTTRVDFDAWRYFLNGHQVNQLKTWRHWLKHDYSNTWPADRKVNERASALVSNALHAIHILTPVGSHNIFFRARYVDSGLDIDSSDHLAAMEETLYGRLAGVPPTFTTEFPTVLKGVEEAFARRIVRLQNPILLLEHGLQATNIHLRTLFWVTGLDALVMSKSLNQFSSRVLNLLGEDTYIFPPNRITGHQPHYRVSKTLIEDLYTFRSEVAHGEEISLKFREVVGFRPDHILPLKDYQYRQVLHECAVFLLCRALKRVFVDGLVDEIASVKKWRQKLEQAV